MTLIDYLLQHLHTALDGGDLPEADATIDNLELLCRGDVWTGEQIAAYDWLRELFDASLPATSADLHCPHAQGSTTCGRRLCACSADAVA